MISPDAPSAAPTKHRRRWFQFSLRTGLLAVTLIAIGLGIFVAPVARRHAVVTHLEGLGCDVKYAIVLDAPWFISTFGKYLPRDWSDVVCHISAHGKSIADSDL